MVNQFQPAGVVAGADADVAVNVVDAGGAIFTWRRSTFIDFDLTKTTHETGTALAHELLGVLGGKCK